jgi:hypothetical protein
VRRVSEARKTTLRERAALCSQLGRPLAGLERAFSPAPSGDRLDLDRPPSVNQFLHPLLDRGRIIILAAVSSRAPARPAGDAKGGKHDRREHDHDAQDEQFYLRGELGNSDFEGG